MKVSFSWTTILRVIFVLVIGCGDSDNPIGEEIPEPPTEPPTNIVSPILGDWRLMDLIWFTDGVVTNQNTTTGWIYGANPNILTLAPDGIFNLTQRYPIHDEVYLETLESEGKGHIHEIVVTFRGKFRLGANQLWLNRVVTRVEPSAEALEFKEFFEDPFFVYDIWAFTDEGTHGKLLDYSLTDDGNQLELRAEKGTKDVKYAIKLVHRRLKTE